MNSIADYLIRVNIPNSLQGRVFGIIGTISQLGYVFAYALSGFLADLYSALASRRRSTCKFYRAHNRCWQRQGNRSIHHLEDLCLWYWRSS